jgi:hypothetical protein
MNTNEHRSSFPCSFKSYLCLFVFIGGLRCYFLDRSSEVFKCLSKKSDAA